MRHCPPENGPHSLSHSSGRLWPSSPYRGENLQHFAASNAVKGRVAQFRHGMTLQGLNPVGRMPGIAPAWFVRLVGCLRGLLEGRHGGRVFFGHRVPTLSNGGPVIRRLLSGQGKAHRRISPEADIPPMGFEPIISALRGRCPRLLDECALSGLISIVIQLPNSREPHSPPFPRDHSPGTF